MLTSTTTIEELANREYKYGFVTEIETDSAPRGLNEDVIRFISAMKNEPGSMLEWRLKAYRHWLTMDEPTWQNVHFPTIDDQDIIYYSAPKSQKNGPASLEEVDPEVLRMYEKLGISLAEQKLLSGVAVDAVLDSVSVATTFKAELAKVGVIFCSFSEAVQQHPELVKKYLGSVVPYNDNFFAALNTAVFSDGSFCYVPKGVRCPLELSTYFRINAQDTGQFERTLIVADEGSYVSYMEGCTAPIRDKNQLHAAVVELVALGNAQIKYATVQNWYPGDKAGKGGIYNFVTKRGKCQGDNSKISWTQVETGSAITWKYPGVILQGDNSIGEFYSVALTNNYQQADTGTKMIHVGKSTKSTIVSKGISAGHGQNRTRNRRPRGWNRKGQGDIRLMSDLRELDQEVILDHNKSPCNFRKLEGANRMAEGFNPLCGDRFTVYLHMEGDVIEDISFQGEGCAISKASASVMTSTLKGKSKAEAQAIIEKFHRVVTRGSLAGVDPLDLDEFGAFAGVREFPLRVKCATLAWHTLRAAMDGKEATVSTE